MQTSNFYSDRKFCTHCEDYVPYLMSVDQSFCAQCGKAVTLFSEKDWESFNESLAARRKGGRPRKTVDRKRESA